MRVKVKHERTDYSVHTYRGLKKANRRGVRALGFVQLFRDSALALSVLRSRRASRWSAQRCRYRYHSLLKKNMAPSSTTYLGCVLAEVSGALWLTLEKRGGEEKTNILVQQLGD